MKSDRRKILVIGSLNVDCVVHVEHTPVTGETILCGDMSTIPGGKGANQACAAGKLGADVILLGAVGKDAHAQLQRESLSKAGVDISHLIEREDHDTGLAFISIDNNGDNSIVVIQGANATLTKEDIDDNLDLIRQSDIILFQLEIPIDTVVYGARRAKELGKMVILDPAPVPRDFPEELYEYVDIVKPNETELSMLTRTPDVEYHMEEAVSCLKGKGVKHVVVTLGENGVYLDSEETGRKRIPAIPVHAVDTTAAGDSFTAALAVMLAEGKNMEEAVSFAIRVSSVVVTRKGAQSSIPTLEEVQELMGRKEKLPGGMSE